MLYYGCTKNSTIDPQSYKLAFSVQTLHFYVTLFVAERLIKVLVLVKQRSSADSRHSDDLPMRDGSFPHFVKNTEQQ